MCCLVKLTLLAQALTTDLVLSCHISHATVRSVGACSLCDDSLIASWHFPPNLHSTQMQVSQTKVLQSVLEMWAIRRMDRSTLRGAVPSIYLNRTDTTLSGWQLQEALLSLKINSLKKYFESQEKHRVCSIVSLDVSCNKQTSCHLLWEKSHYGWVLFTLFTSESQKQQTVRGISWLMLILWRELEGLSFFLPLHPPPRLRSSLLWNQIEERL